MPCPCRVTNYLDCVVPIWFLQCERLWFTHAMPYSCCAPVVLRYIFFFFAFQTSKQECEILLPLLLLETHYESVIFLSLSLLWQKIKPTGSYHILLRTINAGDCQEWQQQTSKQDPLNRLISSSDFSGYHTGFHEGHGISEHGSGAERHVHISATGHGKARHSRGTEWHVWIRR